MFDGGEFQLFLGVVVITDKRDEIGTQQQSQYEYQYQLSLGQRVADRFVLQRHQPLKNALKYDDMPGKYLRNNAR